MRLTGCYIENFGVLHDYRVRFDDGCNVFCKKNGWGKSTLVAFIRVMFYGFEGEGKKDEISNERRRYAPWQGGIYGGEISFVAGEKEYILRRTFGERKKEDRYVLYDARTQTESSDYQDDIGCELFGMDSLSFMRTVYISERDCLTYATDDISKKISNLTYDTKDDHNYEAADKRMISYINKMSPSRKTGKLYKMNEQLTELKVNIAKKEAFTHELKECERRLGMIRKGSGNRNLKVIFAKVAMLVMLILLAEVAGIFLLLNEQSLYGYGFMCVGVFLTCITLYILRKRKRDSNTDEYSLKRENEDIKLLKRTDDIREQLREIDKLSARYEELFELYNKECRKYDNVVIARELLKEAKLNFFAECMPELKRWFEVYRGLFGGQDEVHGEGNSKYSIDAGINLYADEKGMLRRIEHMSMGKRDVAGICMRMAITESMYKEEKPFIIIDDPFMGLDDETMSKALQFVMHISKKYQVIYFTCHKSRSPYV